MTNIDFSSWLQAQLDKEGWSQADLVRRTNLTTGAISHLLAGSRGAGPFACTEIARAFGYPPVHVFVQAGILPRDTSVENSEEIIQIMAIAKKLPEKDAQQLLALAKVMLQQNRADAD